jgi:hypothetical protein
MSYSLSSDVIHPSKPPSTTPSDNVQAAETQGEPQSGKSIKALEGSNDDLDGTSRSRGAASNGNNREETSDTWDGGRRDGESSDDASQSQDRSSNGTDETQGECELS